MPYRAIIVFGYGDLRRVLNHRKHRLAKAWANFRLVYEVEGSNTVITKSYFGGPNLAAIVEELSAFGVKEFVIWGYCGGIGETVNIGDIIAARGALREDGVSYHYMKDRDMFVYTDWFEEWEKEAKDRAFRDGLIWSCDAIYRETGDKIVRYREKGISAVEMEVASLYAVCRYRGIKGIAFLVVSDLLKGEKWMPGFHARPFREGVKRLEEFMLERVIV